MKRKCQAWLAVLVTSFGITSIALGIMAIPKTSYADTGPPCNDGGDPSMPKGCYGWCYSPKICNIHPIKLVCKCR